MGTRVVTSVPHWHLPFIGVDPARQGLGLGRLLLRAGLSRADQDGVECRLFTEQPRNVPLYQRYGFEVAVEEDVSDKGPAPLVHETEAPPHHAIVVTIDDLWKGGSPAAAAA